MAEKSKAVKIAERCIVGGIIREYSMPCNIECGPNIKVVNNSCTQMKYRHRAVAACPPRGLPSARIIRDGTTSMEATKHCVNRKEEGDDEVHAEFARVFSLQRLHILMNDPLLE